MSNLQKDAFGAYIQKRMQTLGISTTRELAARANLGEMTVSRLIRGDYAHPRVDVLVALAKALEVSPLVLIDALGLPVRGAPTGQTPEETALIVEVCTKLPPHERAEVLNFARFLAIQT